jgi:hypothetical protein
MGGNWKQRAGRILVSGEGRSFGGRTLCLHQKPLPERPFDVHAAVKLDNEEAQPDLFSTPTAVIDTMDSTPAMAICGSPALTARMSIPGPFFTTPHTPPTDLKTGTSSPFVRSRTASNATSMDSSSSPAATCSPPERRDLRPFAEPSLSFAGSMLRQTCCPQSTPPNMLNACDPSPTPSAPNAQCLIRNSSHCCRWGTPQSIS